MKVDKELIKRVDTFVKLGVYSNRSDVIRDAVRRFVWEKEIGSVSIKIVIGTAINMKNSVTFRFNESAIK